MDETNLPSGRLIQVLELNSMARCRAPSANHGYLLIFESDRMVIECIAEDDSVKISRRDTSKDVCDDASERAPWNHLLGRECEWCWRCTNDRGYEDMFALAFGVNIALPDVVLCGVASEVKVAVVRSVSNES